MRKLWMTGVARACLTAVAVPMLLVPGCTTGSAEQPQATARRPVVDEYHGVKVTDDYRWLEDWNDPEVKAWSEAQNVRARAHLDGLPGQDALRARLTALLKADNPQYLHLERRPGVLFALKSRPPLEQPLIVAMPESADPAAERVIVDPNAMDPKGGTSIDFFVPSLDGKLLAVSMSEGGSESGAVSVFEAETGRRLPDRVPRVNGGTAGGSVAWNADGSGFYYTRYPRQGERPAADMSFYQQVYFHKVGTPTEEDRYEVGREFPRIAEIELETHESGQYTLATVANGDGGEFEHWARVSDGAWRRITTVDQRCTRAKFYGPDYIAMITYAKSPLGWLALVPAFDPSMANAEYMLREEHAKVIENWQRTDNHVFVVDQDGGMNDMRLYDLRGGLVSFVQLPRPCTVGQFLHTGGESCLFNMETWVNPPAWHTISAERTSPEPTKLATPATVDFSDIEVVREVATAADGTRIPISVMRPRGLKLDGSHPTLLYGYGGYGISITPWYDEARRVWFDAGGVFAVAHIRGGGEFGDRWHRDGNLTKKQTVFDDFHAAMERLKELKYTSSEKLAIMGGSNGGLLMGAMITQHPGDFRAAVAHVGIYDMLRVELSDNGQFNIEEFGTVKKPEHFRAMHAYSPYHHVKDGTAYPAVLFMTGANDPRVDPMQSRKMVARMQAATSSARPILLRTSANAGHGQGSSLSHRVESEVDEYAFLMNELGMTPASGR
jgi:prolyl oligopeptidase